MSERYTIDVEIAFKADSDQAAGAVLVSLISQVNEGRIVSDGSIESFILLRGDVALDVDVRVTEAPRKERRTPLYILPKTPAD